MDVARAEHPHTLPTGSPSLTVPIQPLRVTALAGGGAARFLRGLLLHARERGLPLDVTVVGNTADDLTISGLRVCPDLDTVMYTLGGGVEERQGWGRTEETFTVAEELRAYGRGRDWFTLGDRDVATHVVRTALLAEGRTPTQVTAALCERWQPGVRLLPMSDDPVETHVVLDGTTGDGATVVHFQEWWVRLRAAVPAREFLLTGIERARPAPGVLDAVHGADVILLPPSNPVVSIGPILAVPGLRDAVRAASAPVVGVSPVIGGAPVRGMADACLAAIGVETDAMAVAGLYADLLDGWLVDLVDAPGTPPDRPVVRALPLLMTDPGAAAAIAGAALDLAATLGGPTGDATDSPTGAALLGEPR